jgi:simple sugar transport system permease protein
MSASAAPPRMHPAVSSLAAIGGALVAGAVLLWLSGLDPLRGYTILLTEGLGTSFGVTETLIKTAPLLMVAAGLLVAFRAGVWNIGVDGQLLIGAIFTAALAPWLLTTVPHVPALVLLGLVGAVGGAAWGLLPALLKVHYGLNEIITTIMMNYVAVYLTTWLVKGPFRDLSDPTIIAPQTTVIPESLRLPLLPFGRVHVGLAVGILAVMLVYVLMRNTVLGFKLSVLGANPKAAVHAGFPVGRLTVLAMLVSAAFAGLAGANDVLGVLGMFAADWNPRYGLIGVALVFLARFNGLTVIPLAYFFSFLRFGGELMSRTAGIPIFFVDVLKGLMLVFFAAGEVLERR